jgi:hypothetical protein
MKAFTDLDEWRTWLIGKDLTAPFCFIWKSRRMLAKRDRRGMWAWRGTNAS